MKTAPTGEQSGAAQTPLADLLRGVPLDTRLEINKEPYCVHLIPIGKRAHEAADLLETLQSETTELKKEVDRYRKALVGITKLETFRMAPEGEEFERGWWAGIAEVKNKIDTLAHQALNQKGESHE